MALEFEYGINTKNRFYDLTGHDEDPDEFISTQSKIEEKPKEKSKEPKKSATGSKKKSNVTGSTNDAPVTSEKGANNKGTAAPKGNEHDQQKSAKVSFNKGTNDDHRAESARGGGRGTGRGGNNAGFERPRSEGTGSRGGGNQRPPRSNRFDSQRQGNETGGFDQPSEGFADGGNENQQGEYRGRGRGRGRGIRSRGTFEIRRGGGRGRGPRGGRGGFGGPRPDGDNQYQSEGFQQETGTFDFNENDFGKTQFTSQSGNDSGIADGSTVDQRYSERGRGRGNYRARTFRSNRNYGAEHEHDSTQENTSQSDYRKYRHRHDREQRNEITSVKPIEKKDGDGANNWGNKLENADDVVIHEETGEKPAAPGESSSRAWHDVVEEAEQRQLTLDEYKRQNEAKKKLAQEKIPALKPRAAGEGEDPNAWKQVQQVYRKKNDDEVSEEDAENEDEESEVDEEETAAKKKILTIPLTFKDNQPRDTRGSFNSGRKFRGGSAGNRERGNFREQRDFDSTNDRRAAPYENTDDQQNQDREQPSNRGSGRGSRPSYPRGEYRRRPFNQNRGGQGRPHDNRPAQLNLANTDEFPSLEK